MLNKNDFVNFAFYVLGVLYTVQQFFTKNQSDHYVVIVI